MRPYAFGQAPCDDLILKAAFPRAPCLLLGREITAETFAGLQAGCDAHGKLDLCPNDFAQLRIDGTQELAVLFPSPVALNAVASLVASVQVSQALGMLAMEVMHKQMLSSGAIDRCADSALSESR